jgi:hypothetical protein
MKTTQSVADYIPTRERGNERDEADDAERRGLHSHAERGNETTPSVADCIPARSRGRQRSL